MEERARILGVDDSLTIRKALELVLKPAGYQLELAASGAEALEKARGFRPSVLLLDFILPDMRGTEVCKKLAADPETATIPVVLISAKGAEIRQAYQDVGNVVSYITKPFTPEDVTGVVADVLARAKEGSLIKPDLAAAAPAAAVAPAPAPVAPPAVAPAAAPVVPAPVAAAPAAASVPAARVEPPPITIAPPAPVEPPAPLAGVPPPPAAAPVEAPAAEAWEEGEEGAEEEVAARVPAISDAARREAMEGVLEALRSGLEGVYVEEVDTTTGAAADEAKSYTDLASQLTHQLGETLVQARSGARFILSSDGSVRSLQEMLFDAYRRVCRLFFRAVGTGAVGDEEQAARARVLVACRKESDLYESMQLLGRQDEWHGLVIGQRFRQLPIMLRLYGPTHLVVEAGRGALWDQLRIVRSMPEGRRLKILAIVRPDGEPGKDAAVFSELGIDAVVEDGPDVLDAVRSEILSGQRGVRGLPAGAMSAAG